ncbi:MAG: hypothetical protein PHU12_01875 [Candidatus Aenigmarchaeota archaeon]|nr:hypothetical protein [Candidatus Aenigmarchaeota archaeon]
MKGISAVLATVLIVVITVAIIGLAYGWSTGLFKIVSDTSEESTQSAVGGIQKQIELVAAKCVDTDSITGLATGGGDVINPPKSNSIVFSIKNIGSAKIISSEIDVFLNNSLVENVVSDDLDVGTTAQYHFTTNKIGNVEFKVNSPAGAVTKDLICPPIQ